MIHTDEARQEYLQRAENHFHGTFMWMVCAALRDHRISLDQFAAKIGMSPVRLRRLLTGASRVRLDDLSDAATGVGHELTYGRVRIQLEPIMTAADLWIEGGSK